MTAADKTGGLGSLFDQPQTPQANAPQVLSVTDALNLAKVNLEKVWVTVEGEVSEFSDKPGYKAVYFTLTDQRSAMPCLIWKSEFANTGLQLRKGMLLQVRGNFSLYAAKGRMNFVAREMKLAGEGDLRMKVAQLARKLQVEGLMDPARKQELPRLPEKVAVVTSPRGKAVHDVLRTLRRRSPQIHVYVAGVPVEGKQAVSAICEGLACADQSDCDVILLVRGGGSYEDLMPFNDEQVARAVVACRKPVITGIGHEPDNTIADMVSDRRCSTPTAAAEAVAPDVEQLQQSLQRAQQRITVAAQGGITYRRQRLEQLASRPLFRDPSFVLAPFAMRLDIDTDKLPRAIPASIAANKARLQQDRAALQGLAARLVPTHMTRLQQDQLRLIHALPASIAGHGRAVENAQQRLRAIGSHTLDRYKRDISVSAARLSALSPLSVLSRGYAVTYDDQGHVVAHGQQAQVGQTVSVMLQDAYLDCTVDDIRQHDALDQLGGSDD